ncbi:hypothetical protein [Pendulispora albinea]|uniref:DUF5050 domain-containing protein n=1 Tax=Pendulispora albinea TaxID=2741071 RepID=A0ABZ2LMM0_9BACT
MVLDQRGAVVTNGLDVGGVYYVPFDGGGRVDTIASPQTGPQEPSSDGARVCWFIGNNTIQCTLHDGGSLVVANDNLGSPRSTAIVGGQAYWIANAASDLRRFPLDGSTNRATIVATYASNGFSGARSLVIDGSRFVWLVRDNKAIAAATLDGTLPAAATTVAKIPRVAPNAVAVGANAYYVVAEDLGEMGGLYRAPKDGTGGDATPLVRQSLIEPTIAVDANYAYYTDRNGGTIYRFPLNATLPDGGTAFPEAIAKGQGSPTGIGVTDKFVYWLNVSGANTGLMRVAK